MVVSLNQRSVPLDADTETLILVAPDGKVRPKEHRERNIRLFRNAAQQRRLVLDGVAHQVGEPDSFGHEDGLSVLVGYA